MPDKSKDPNWVGIRVENSENLDMKDNFVAGTGTGYEVKNAKNPSIAGNVHIAPTSPPAAAESWWKRWARELTIGLIVAVAGGLLVYWLTKP